MAKSNQKKSYKNKKISFNPLAMACALISLPALTISNSSLAATINYTGNAADLQTTPGNYGSFNSFKTNSLFPGVGTPEASNNIITIDYTSGTDPSRVYGGMSSGLNSVSTNNSVTLTEGIVQGIDGGFGYTEKSSANTSANISNNTVIIAGGVVEGTAVSGISSVFGGIAQNDQQNGGNTSFIANNNAVIITGGSVTKRVIGGYSNPYSLNGNSETTTNHNRVEVSGGSVSGDVWAALSSSYTLANSGQFQSYSVADYNTVTISGGSVSGQVRGGYSGITNNSSGQSIGSASYNTVNISGGYVGGNVYAAYLDASSNGNGTYDLKVINNTVNISGTPTFGSSTSLYGGYMVKGTNGTYTTEASGNTLNFSSNGVAVRNVDGFQSYNFNIPNTVADGDVMLNATGYANLEDATVSLKSIASGAAVPAGSQVTLINANTLQTNGGTVIRNNVPVYQGISLKYDVTVEQAGNNSIVASFSEAAPQVIEENTKPLAEGRLAGLAYTLQGADLAAEQGIKAALASASLGDAALTAFGTVSGASSRYDSGSHVDVDGVSMLAGLAWKQDDLVLAGFLEGGKGNYDSYNSFDNAASVHGNGDTSYYGVGVLGRYTLDNGIYLDGTARVGQVDTDFNSRDITNAEGVNASYDSKSTYYSASIGAGYAWKLSEKSLLDVSAQYLWTHQGGDSVNVAGDPIDFAAANSHRVRTLARLYQDVSPQVTLMAGLGYEYEFDGEVNGTTYHSYAIDAPSIKGGTGLGELGVSFSPTSTPNFSLEAKVRGYAGKREGYAGYAQVKYAF